VRIAVALLLVVACSDAPERAPLVVFAASSLTEAFQELEGAFEASHPDIDVQPTFAGSQVLRLQIEHGAPADVFASADPAHMEPLLDDGIVQAPQTFASNELALIVPERDDAIESFADLDRARRVVVGAPSVPVGRYTRALLERALATHGDTFVSTVRGAIASEELNVRLVRAKVQLGEADAAFVYRTDVAHATGIRSLPIPPELQQRAAYPIAVVARSERRSEASAFVDFVRGVEGRAILERHGFGAEAP